MYLLLFLLYFKYTAARKHRLLLERFFIFWQLLFLFLVLYIGRVYCILPVELFLQSLLHLRYVLLLFSASYLSVCLFIYFLFIFYSLNLVMMYLLHIITYIHRDTNHYALWTHKRIMFMVVFIHWKFILGTIFVSQVTNKQFYMHSFRPYYHYKSTKKIVQFIVRTSVLMSAVLLP